MACTSVGARLRWLDSNQRWGCRRVGLTVRSLLPTRVHRIMSVRTVGFEPTISCFRSRRNGQAFPRPDSRAPSGSRTRTSAMARRQAAATSWALGWKPNCQRPKSTGWESNPRRRITKAVSSPLDHRCRNYFYCVAVSSLISPILFSPSFLYWPLPARHSAAHPLRRFALHPR